MTGKRLILFAGVYDTLDIFTDQLKKAFEERGYEIMLFDSRNMQESLVRLSDFIRQPVRAALTFNNLGFNMELVKGRNIWEDLGIPCINILMDHPFCYKPALDAAPMNGIVLCIDRNHMKYLNRFHSKIPVTGFLPHGGIELPGVKKPIREREIDVLYAGGLSKRFAANVMPDFTKYKGFDQEELCRRVYEDVTAHPYKTTEQGIEEQLLKMGVLLEDARLGQVIADFHFLDLYIVSYFRERAVAAVANAGIELHLYGAGWEDCAWISLPNVHYMGKVSADRIVELMRNTKIVLNTMTWFKDGTHERVFNGMLQGAVTVSDSSVYMKEEFDGSEDGEMILFELEELEILPEKIKKLLNDPVLAQGIADRGYQKAKQSHTWTVRANELDGELLSELS